MNWQGQLRRFARTPFETQREFENLLARMGWSERDVIPRGQGKYSRRGHQRRQLVAFYLFELGCHEKDIAECLERDRSTVLYGIDKVRQALKSSGAAYWRASLDRFTEGNERRKEITRLMKYSQMNPCYRPKYGSGN